MIDSCRLLRNALEPHYPGRVLTCGYDLGDAAAHEPATTPTFEIVIPSPIGGPYRRAPVAGDGRAAGGWPEPPPESPSCMLPSSA
jgi:hypothetical protein